MKQGYAGPNLSPLQTALKVGTAQAKIGFTFLETIEECDFMIMRAWLEANVVRDGWFLAETELDGIKRIRVWVVDELDAVFLKLRWY